MKTYRVYLFCISLFTLYGQAMSQISRNMVVLSNYNNLSLRGVPSDDTGPDIWNDCTAWYNSANGREYAIAGTTDSIYVFDITEEGKMKICDIESGLSTYATNRDYVTFSHYLYTTADQATGAGALQIFDLQYLPDSLHKVYESSEFGYFSHTIFADTISKRLYMCSNLTSKRFSAMDILSIDTPEQPSFLASLVVPTDNNGTRIFRRVHEMYVRHDTVYASCEDAGLYIFDMRDVHNQKLIGSITSYPFKGYNHSSWLDPSGKYINFTDENEGMAVKLFDLTDLSNPRLVSTFNSNPSCMPHNTYWIGDLIYSSAYHDGVVIWDVHDKANPKEIAYYDTHPANPEKYGGYKGCWGVWPYLPSGKIVASDLRSGIWILRMDTSLNGIAGPQANESLHIFPNPVHSQLHLAVESHSSFEIRIENMEGKMVYHARFNKMDSLVDIDVSDWKNGLYIATLKTSGGTEIQKILKTN